MSNLEGEEEFDPAVLGEAAEFVQTRIADDELILVGSRRQDYSRLGINIAYTLVIKTLKIPILLYYYCFCCFLFVYNVIILLFVLFFFS